MTQEEWEAVLCFVDPRKTGWAWFTTGRLEDVSGDDFNDAPYECNCSEPYHGTPGSHFVKAAFDGSFEDPKDGHYNSPYCVDDINAGAVAWLRPSTYGSPHKVCIQAGTTLRDFIRKVHDAGGEVYLPVEATP